MNYILKFISIILFLSLVSCSEKSINNPIENNSGKIQLKVNRANAPKSVVTVSATLSRTGYDNITGTLNLLSDSTADIMLNDVHTGTWHLLVNAEDSAGVILYTGNSDVEILAGFITQVNLTLNPTGEGTGSIYIFVNWGTTTTKNWTDYSNNPILNRQNTNYDVFGVSQPFVIKENNTYKMWYNGLSSRGVAYVFYATSINGIIWNKRENPVLYPGNEGDWDSGRAGPGPVIKIDNIYYMYYHSWQHYWEIGGIGLATSTDGINWTKYPQPILTGGDWDFHLMATSVVRKNDLYYMYYSGGSEYRIGLATSTDGISWTKSALNPIIVPTLTWEQNSTGYPSVILENGLFKMIYVSLSSDNSFFGWATSTNGVDWGKQSLPIFSSSNVSNLFYRIHYPNFISDGNEYKLYYSVYDNQNILHISLATKSK